MLALVQATTGVRLVIQDLLHGLVAQTAEAGTEGEGPGLLLSVLPWVAVFAFFYLLILRPQQKQQKEAEQFRAQLKKGDDVVLNSGIFGKVFAVGEADVTVEIAPNVKVRALKSAVATYVPGTKAGDVKPGDVKAIEADKKS
jgi:preprotein translocase subunit YajC